MISNICMGHGVAQWFSHTCRPPMSAAYRRRRLRIRRSAGKPGATRHPHHAAALEEGKILHLKWVMLLIKIHGIVVQYLRCSHHGVSSNSVPVHLLWTAMQPYHIQVDWVLFMWSSHGCRGPAIEFFSPPTDYRGPWCGLMALRKGLNHAMQNPMAGIPIILSAYDPKVLIYALILLISSGHSLQEVPLVRNVFSDLI